ncbi:NUDIX hydrolase [Catellatospora sichuanensis]|uniref:NUDIX hydrolase n=1 Tax=Catellatospora sichuanensis TaxID=1969805 RepID=UPI001183DFF3|nr:NUDIX domain-containing protein [Catellatospora sichuanensis]
MLRPHAAARVTVDLVILTVRSRRLDVLLVERGNEPFRGRWALPGGFVRDDENLLAAARRELDEETGIGSAALHLEQIGTYGDPGRDPSGRVVSVAYLAIAPDLPTPQAASDATAARWQPVADTAGLAYDHDAILADGLELARGKLETTTLATAFCADLFTLVDLRRVYEAVWGRPLDPRNFERKVNRTEGFVVPTGQRRSLPTGRPPALYQRGPGTVLYPAMLRTRIDSPHTGDGGDDRR